MNDRDENQEALKKLTDDNADSSSSDETIDKIYKKLYNEKLITAK